MPREIRLKWNAPQSAFMVATERYVDFEGAIRAGKTTPAIWKVIGQCVKYPGMYWLMTRWTQDSLDAQLKPRFYELCPVELLKRWSPKEDFQEFTNGSRIYLRALRSAEEASRYRKFQGLTLAGVYIDQPEEVPEDVILALKGRLSQPGYPQQLLLTPNPPEEDHWLARMFPEDNSRPDHRLIHTTVYDNRAILGEEYIKALEADYPPGHALHRRYILGKRGLATVGEPVYKGYFKRAEHVRECAYVPEVPLLRGWDFGHRHPAVTWAQFTPWGEFRLLHEVMGDAQFLEDFAPHILRVTQTLFPTATMIQDCCDPAGAEKQGHGLRRTAIDVLRDHGVYPRYITGANDPGKRDYAIQQIARAMLTLTRQGPAFTINPRCRVLIDGFEAGYVWEQTARTGTSMPNTRRPLKDNFYDHLQNTVEYLMLNFGGVQVLDWKQKRAQVRAQRHLQRDVDEYDVRRPRIATGLSRAGY